RGAFALDSAGRAAGKAGNVSLATYSGSFSIGGPPLPVTTSPLTASILLGGSDGSASGNGTALPQLINAYRFAQGGTLPLQALSMDIGRGTGPGDVALPAGYFDGNGFSAYSLTAVADHLTVAAGTGLVLRQRNFVPDPSLVDLATGAKLSQSTGLD